MPVFFNGEEFTFFNPDGSEVRVRGWGNQSTAIFETPDGYSVVKDPVSGFLAYATLSDDGTALVPSGHRVGTVDPAALNLPQHLRIRGEAATVEAALEATGVRPRWKERREGGREKASSPRSPRRKG